MKKELAAIGIDIGGTNTCIGLVSETGKILHKESFSTISDQNQGNFDFYLDQISSKIQLIREKHRDIFQIKGVGIGAPNGNSKNGNIEYAVNLPWAGILPVKEKLGYKCKLQVFLTNDANAAGIGEKIFGGAKHMKDFIVITLGTGLGGAIFSNNCLLEGYSGFAGELGHTVIIPEGRLCNCGRKGCLETYVSATGLLVTAKNKIEKYNIRGVTNVNSSKEVFLAALQQEQFALDAFQETALLLGRSLADFAAIFSPEAFFLLGGLANAGELLINPAKIEFEKNLLQVHRNKISILPSELPANDAAILGAAALIFNSQN